MISYAECEFIIPTSHSLKEKRAVLQRMLTRTKQKFNVSIAEIDHQDVWQRTRIAIVFLSKIYFRYKRGLIKLKVFLESNPEWERTETIREHL